MHSVYPKLLTIENIRAHHGTYGTSIHKVLHSLVATA